MGLEHVAPSIEAMNRKIVMDTTWGHLAPERNKTYRGHIVWALGIHGSDYLNPLVLELNMGDLPSSPWFYDAMIDFLGKVHEDMFPDDYSRKSMFAMGNREEAISGRVWRWDGTFRNYSWCGKVRQLHCQGLNDDKLTAVRKTSSSKLTKKDFVKIASEIRAIKTCVARQKKAKELIPSLRAANPNFDETRFLQACNA